MPYIVMQGLCFSQCRWPWFTTATKKQAERVLRALNYRKVRDVFTSVHGTGPEYAVIVEVETVTQVLAEGGVK